jgi:hypothetical protein
MGSKKWGSGYPKNKPPKNLAVSLYGHLQFRPYDNDLFFTRSIARAAKRTGEKAIITFVSTKLRLKFFEMARIDVKLEYILCLQVSYDNHCT